MPPSYAQLVAEQLDLAAGTRARRPGRHRPHRDRRRHRRLELDPGRRRGASTAPSKTLADQLKELAADVLEASAGDHRDRRRRGLASPAPTASISFADLAAHPSATPEKLHRRRRIRHRAADLSERHAHRRSRDRSRHRRDRDRHATSSSTISAPRSIRCCSRARCMAAWCRASARR